MFKKSMQDVAYELMLKKKRPVQFEKLWDEVQNIMGFSTEEVASKIAPFYTRITLDGRFVNLGDNVWDLRSRQTFDKVHIDMNDAYSEEEEEEEKDIDEIDTDLDFVEEEDEETDEEDEDSYDS